MVFIAAGFFIATTGITHPLFYIFIIQIIPSQQWCALGLCPGLPSFIIYFLPLSNIFRKFSKHSHCYTDDTQLYRSSEPIRTPPPSSPIDCLNENSQVKTCLPHNFLKRNCSKTEFLLIGTKSTISKSDIFWFHPLIIPPSIPLLQPRLRVSSSPSQPI